jgi:lipooligosaccharide transport system ATP-binding protein
MLLSTHYMDEAAYLCDRLLILDRGRIVAEGTPPALVARHVGQEVLELRPTPSEREALVARLTPLGVEHQASGPVVFVFSKDGRGLARELEGSVAHLTYRTANLEDVFLRLTGRELREG